MRASVEIDSRFESFDMAPSYCRKRPRSQDEEFDESIPISKRIHSLYLEGRPDCSPESIPSPESPLAESSHTDQSYELWQRQQQHQQLPHHLDCVSNIRHKPGSSLDMSGVLANRPHTSYHHPHHQQQQTSNSFLDNSHNTAHNNIKKYQPTLDEASNPYYYRSNEVLFKAHVARMGRLTKSPLSDHSHLSFSR